MYTITVAHNAQSGYIAAASQRGPDVEAACGTFAPTPQQAATSAMDALFAREGRRAAAARDWAALQARIPLTER